MTSPAPMSEAEADSLARIANAAFEFAAAHFKPDRTATEAHRSANWLAAHPPVRAVLLRHVAARQRGLGWSD